MEKIWHTPAGEYPILCADILTQPHTLIAGTTGSGKSVLINALIYAATFKAPPQVGLVLIDPKRVELIQYANMPHVLGYASEPDQIAEIINGTIGLMENRYKEMQNNRQKQSEHKDIFLIIDEFADLMTTQKAQVLPPIQRIAQLGRAAKVHLIIATQRPTRDIIDGRIKVNIDARLALRCPTAQDSRNIINVKGAETLPRFGYGYYLTPDRTTPELWEIPYTDPAQLAERVEWWESQKEPDPPKRRHWWQYWNS